MTKDRDGQVTPQTTGVKRVGKCPGGRAFRASRALSTLLLACWALGAAAQAPTPKLSDHVKADIERHRAMAAAHEAAARCLASGRAEADCVKDLQAACKGLAIGKYCGMKHAH